MKTNQLSPGAQEVLKNVLAAMQSAEELGGVDSTEDYVRLMDTIAMEVATRKANAVEAS
jgi:hypothetical protein